MRWALLVLFAICGTSRADQWNPACNLPVEVRSLYRNIGYQGGSCVQMSIGMVGADQNVEAAAMLPFDSEYGPAVLGGSGPQRVIAYMAARNIKGWNITGSQTFEWMRWCVRNGRGCAMGAGSSHFQTLWGGQPDYEKWFVCNNNSPQKIDEYSAAEFRRLHLASGPWIVVLDAPPAPKNPRYIKWW